MPCNLNRGIGHTAGAVNYKWGQDETWRARNTAETGGGTGRVIQNWRWRKESGEESCSRERRTVNLIIAMSSLPPCVCVYTRSIWCVGIQICGVQLCPDMYLCVCPAGLLCLRAPDSDQSVWALTDCPLGLRSKKCLQWTLITSWRKYLYQWVCFYGEEKWIPLVGLSGPTISDQNKYKKSIIIGRIVLRQSEDILSVAI